MKLLFDFLPCTGYLNNERCQPLEVWNGGVGFVYKKMIQAHCPAPAPDVKILKCGPPPMNKAMVAHLDNIGYTSEMQFLSLVFHLRWMWIFFSKESLNYTFTCSCNIPIYILEINFV